MPTCGRQSAICSWFSPSIYHVGPRNQSAHQAFFAFFNGFYPLNHCSGQKHYNLMTVQNSQALKLLKLYINYLYSLQQPYMTVQKFYSTNGENHDSEILCNLPDITYQCQPLSTCMSAPQQQATHSSWSSRKIPILFGRHLFYHHMETPSTEDMAFRNTILHRTPVEGLQIQFPVRSRKEDTESEASWDCRVSSEPPETT